jgi:2-amino-4-hydroxy-6-hydroxymethyldihydropteridine diphosphokinase
MSTSHKFYLSLGSNIEPEKNLAEALFRLQEHGVLQDMSSVWESPAVGARGPNFLNLCISYVVPLPGTALKSKVLLPIERALGRARGRDRNAPRTIDIDILMMDGRPLNLKRWATSFVLIPMAELLPDFTDPAAGQSLSDLAKASQAAAWIVRRPEALNAIHPH